MYIYPQGHRMDHSTKNFIELIIIIFFCEILFSQHVLKTRKDLHISN